MTYWILAQLFVGFHKPSLFSPADKHLRVRHNYAYKISLATRNTVNENCSLEKDFECNRIRIPFKKYL